MFTGIITDLGGVRSVVADGDRRFELGTTLDTSGIDTGASVCCSGVCLTVTETGPGWFAVSVSEETLSRSTLGTWQAGTGVNLERALKVGDELGGHIVSGHVDGVGTLVEQHEEGGSVRMTFRAPERLVGFIAPKGSITVDGVSLTVNDVDDPCFGVNIIPHTRTVTTLGQLQPGGRVNLEIDMLARYVAKYLDQAT